MSDVRTEINDGAAPARAPANDLAQAERDATNRQMVKVLVTKQPGLAAMATQMIASAQSLSVADRRVAAYRDALAPVGEWKFASAKVPQRLAQLTAAQSPLASLAADARKKQAVLEDALRQIDLWARLVESPVFHLSQQQVADVMNMARTLKPVVEDVTAVGKAVLAANDTCAAVAKEVTAELSNDVRQAVAVLKRQSDREAIATVVNGIELVLSVAGALDVSTLLVGEPARVLKALLTDLSAAYNAYKDWQAKEQLNLQDALAALGPFDIAKAGIVKTGEQVDVAIDNLVAVLGAVPGVGNVLDAVVPIIKPAVHKYLEVPLKIAETRSEWYNAEVGRLRRAGGPLDPAAVAALKEKAKTMQVEAATSWKEWRTGLSDAINAKQSEILDAIGQCLQGVAATAEYFAGQIIAKVTETLLQVIPMEPAQEIPSIEIAHALSNLKSAYSDSLRAQISADDAAKLDHLFHYAAH
jgi:hypothetical protein